MAKFKLEKLINTFTSIEELMTRRANYFINLAPVQMFEMGQFYEWMKPYVWEQSIADLESEVEVPNEFSWVVYEVSRWRW